MKILIFLYIWYDLGFVSNTKADFLAPYSLLFYANSHGIKRLHLLGDSQVVIDWENRKSKIEIMPMQHLWSHTHTLMQYFDWNSFTHIYQELNKKWINYPKKLWIVVWVRSLFSNTMIVKGSRAWNLFIIPPLNYVYILIMFMFCIETI